MDEWVGTREAADELGVTLRMLYRLIDEGRLPAYKMGRVIRLRSEDLTCFREGGGSELPPGSAPPGAMALDDPDLR